MPSPDDVPESNHEGGSLEKREAAGVEGLVVDPDTGQPIGQLTMIAQRESYWSAPLPSPDALEAFDRVLPGLAERIVVRFEREAEHREDMERDTIRAAIRSESRGQTYGFIVVMTVIVGGFVAIALGWPVYGVATILAALAGLAGVFVYGRAKGTPQFNGPPRPDTDGRAEE